MKRVFTASEAEREVLEKLWDQKEGIKQSQLLALFEADGKEWKRQTLNTFLSRLEEKGLVTREHRIVKTVVSREDYHYKQIQAAIDAMYGGRLSNLVAAYYKGEHISESEKKELKRIVESYEK